MPEAVDSNSTVAPKIQPAHLINNLGKLSEGLNACKSILADVPATGSNLKTALDSIGTMLDSLITQARRQMDDTVIFIHQTPVNIRSMRDEFIAKKLEQGFSAREISQVLNMPARAIERMITRYHRRKAHTNTGDYS